MAFDSPDDLRGAAWAAMGRGVADRRHPARTPTFATIGPHGPEARTVVLRGWQGGVAEMHSDADSAKVSELHADPRATLHVWVPKQDLQVRLRGIVTLTRGDADRWAHVPEGARRVYGGSPPPGDPLDTPGDFAPSPALDRFCVLELRVEAADVLHLGADLHRRAAVLRDGDGWISRWIAP